MIAALLRSGVLRTSAVFGAGALAFAGANLLFARQLTAEAYGTLALVVALVALGSPIAPFGLDAIVVRHRIPAEPRLVLRCAATSMLLAGIMAGVGAIIYGLASAELAVIAAAVLGGGCVRLAAAKLQSEEQFVASTLTVESMNFLLLVAAAVALLLGLTDASGPLRLVAISQLGLAVLIWARLSATRPERSRTPAPIRSSEALLLTGAVTAALLAIQLERLAIPLLLTVESLAAFAVLAVFTIAPFRFLEVGIYRTLMPRLRNAPNAATRRRLFLRTTAQAAGAVVALGVAVLFLAPPVLALVLGDKYDFTSSLILAAVVGGQLRVARSLLGATISALADTRGLAVWNGVVWLSVAAMFAGGSVGASWGLEGLLWGVALGRTATVALGGPLIVRPLRSD